MIASWRRAASLRIETSATACVVGPRLVALEGVAAGEEPVGDGTDVLGVVGGQGQRDGGGVADVAGGHTGGASYLLER